MQKSKFQQKRTILLIFRNKFLQYRKNRKEHIGTSKKNILSKGTSSNQNFLALPPHPSNAKVGVANPSPPPVTASENTDKH